jgi:prepilin-type N-terminal cleavage/methylation domain-containing protein
MTRNRQSGFSLVELMVVVAILTILMGIVFTTVANVQRRSQTETQKVDITQNSREFIDQIGRDLRNVGYPNIRMYSAAAGLSFTSTKVAAGIVAASATDLWFEGDMDGSGVISSVRYQLTADATGNCPCSLQRSAVNKLSGAWTSQSTSYSSELGNLVNSIGGSSPWTIAGNAPSGSSNDTVYAGYKSSPVFEYYDKNNDLITVPDTLGDSSSLNTAHAVAPTVAYVVVTINVLAPFPDQQTGLRPATTMRTAVRISNLR